MDGSIFKKRIKTRGPKSLKEEEEKYKEDGDDHDDHCIMVPGGKGKRVSESKWGEEMRIQASDLGDEASRKSTCASAALLNGKTCGEYSDDDHQHPYSGILRVKEQSERRNPSTFYI